MAEVRDWSFMRDMSARLLEQRTGEDVAAWMRRIRAEGPGDQAGLRDWLQARGVTGYARSLLIWERFGYPDFLTASADQLIDGQYADRPQLRPIYDTLVEAAAGLGEVAVQSRKTYVSLVSPRRTFARIQPTTRSRVDLGLRLEGRTPEGRLRPSRIHDNMPVEVRLERPDEVDAEVLALLDAAYRENS